MKSKSPIARILSAQQVCSVVGLSRTTIWRLYRAGSFPKPICLSPGRVGWSENAIQVWLAERIRGANDGV